MEKGTAMAEEESEAIKSGDVIAEIETTSRR